VRAGVPGPVRAGGDDWKGMSMRRTAGLAGLAIITVAGLAPATALPPPQALAAARAASVPGGTRLWAASYRDHTQQNYPQAIVASPDGSTVYVTGRSNLAHFTTVAYDAATGARRWVARFYGLGYSQPLSMAISPDGSELFVAGFTEPAGFSLPDRFAIVAYNASTGAMLWVHLPFQAGVGASVAVSPDGSTVYVTGVIASRSGPGEVATFAYDAATGARRWLASYRGARPSFEPQAVASSPDGREVIVTSTVTGSSGSPFNAVLAYNAATGTSLWTRFVRGTSGGRDLALSPDGSAVFVTGTDAGAAGGSSFMTTAFGTVTGSRLWQRFYQGPGGTSAANAVTVSPDGRDVFVTGSSTAGGSGSIVVDYATVGYAAATGTRLWARTYQPPVAASLIKDGAIAAGVSPDGGLVFVTGGTPLNATTDTTFTTIAYHADTGATAWLARYGGVQDFGWATALAVGPAGQVFVTGAAGASDGCCNFGTVAYQP